MYIFNKYGAPKLYGKSFDDIDVLTTDKRNEAFAILEEILEKNLYVARTQDISIADLSCYCEVIALKWAAFDYSKFPRLFEWMKKVEKVQEVKEAHLVFEKLLPRVKL